MMFLEISQNLQENTCDRVSFLIRLQAYTTLSKKRLWHSCFPVNFVKLLRTPFFTEHLWELLLYSDCFKRKVVGHAAGKCHHHSQRLRLESKF